MDTPISKDFEPSKSSPPSKGGKAFAERPMTGWLTGRMAGKFFSTGGFFSLSADRPPRLAKPRHLSFRRGRLLCNVANGLDRKRPCLQPRSFRGVNLRSSQAITAIEDGKPNDQGKPYMHLVSVNFHNILFCSSSKTYSLAMTRQKPVNSHRPTASLLKSGT